MLKFPALFTTTALSVFAFSAFAAPVGGVVSAGSAQITQTPGLTSITQGTDRAAIDWQSFNVGTNESVVFQQPSANAIALNRIHDQNPSQILGSIKANGQVILSNPNGMIFGRDSQVDVAGLVATTAGIGNDAFMSGGPLKLTIPGNADAKIIANGSITAKDSGLIAFLAPNVENNGVISAKLGKVQLAGGETATLDLYGDGLVSIAVNNATETSVTHTGMIQSSWITLTATDASHLIDSTVNVDGIIDANNSRQNADGTLTFGGKIEVTARDVTLENDARLRATGKDGGGIIKVGGGWQGKGTIANATNTTVKAGARINASATDNGDGGIVAVWSDDTTQFDGTVLAKGGINGGNGGHIETSGKINLGLSGFADASSPFGTTGEWLLDPRDVRIQNNATAGTENNVPAGGGTIDPPSNTYLVSAESISTALTNGNNVTITTGTTGTQTGNITFNAATISKTGGGDATLTLKADGAVTVTGTNSISSNTGKLHLILWSDTDNSGIGNGNAGSINLTNATINTNGGDIVIGGGLDDGANGGTAADGRPDNFAWSKTASAVNITTASLTTNGGNIRILGSGWNDPTSTGGAGAIISGSTLNLGDGNLEIDGISGNSTNVNIGVYITNTSTVSLNNGSITLRGRSIGSRGTASAFGVYVGQNSSVTIAGTGSFTATGYGGSHLAGGNSGVHIHAGTAITTHSGNITITGYGGRGVKSAGVGLDGGAAGSFATIQTDTGHIDIKGYGGNGTDDESFGILLKGNNNITATGAGTIDLYLEKGNGALTDMGTRGTTFNNTSISTALVGGQISIVSNSLDVPNLSLQGETVQITPRTPSTDIGIAGAPGAMQISASLLDHINAGNLIIGDTNTTGFINVGPYGWDDPVEFKTSFPGIIQLTGAQTAIAGSDAALVFDGFARTYYTIDLSAASGGGSVTFNGTRQVLEGGSSGGGGGGDNLSPGLPQPPSLPPVVPPSSNPVIPPSSPGIPPLVHQDTSFAIRSQDAITRTQVGKERIMEWQEDVAQVEAGKADFSHFANGKSFYNQPLYRFSSDYDDGLTEK